MFLHQKPDFLHLYNSFCECGDIKLIKLRVVLAMFWTLVVIVLLSNSLSDIAELNFIKIGVLDKLIHFALFFIAGMVWVNAISNYNGTQIFRINFALGLVLLVMTELMQSPQIIGRIFKLLYIIANLLGTSFEVKY